MARLLLKSGIVVTQDPKLGVLPTGDVLVENDRIAAIASTLPVTDAETVDCRGHFVLPGLINAHMHTWQTALRSVAANWTLLEYFRHVHAGLATVFDAGRHPNRDTRRGAEPARPWRHHPGRLGAQQSDTRAHRCRHRRPEGKRHSCRVLPRLAQARSQAWGAALLGGPSPAPRDRAPVERTAGRAAMPS